MRQQDGNVTIISSRSPAPTTMDWTNQMLNYSYLIWYKHKNPYSICNHLVVFFPFVLVIVICSFCICNQHFIRILHSHSVRPFNYILRAHPFNHSSCIDMILFPLQIRISYLIIIIFKLILKPINTSCMHVFSSFFHHSLSFRYPPYHLQHSNYMRI